MESKQNYPAITKNGGIEISMTEKGNSYENDIASG